MAYKTKNEMVDYFIGEIIYRVGESNKCYSCEGYNPCFGEAEARKAEIVETAKVFGMSVSYGWSEDEDRLYDYVKINGKKFYLY